MILFCNFHFVSDFESKADVVPDVGHGMVEQRRPKLLVKLRAEAVQPLQAVDEPHIGFPLPLPVGNLRRKASPMLAGLPLSLHAVTQVYK